MALDILSPRLESILHLDCLSKSLYNSVLAFPNFSRVNPYVVSGTPVLSAWNLRKAT